MFDRLLDDDQPADVRHAVTPLTLARFSSNTLYRLTPPFLGVIARGLGVSVDTMGVALSVGEVAGLASPVVGRRIDRADRRTGMVTGLAVLVVAAALIAASPGVVAFACALVIISLGKFTYDAAMSAWIGDHVDYRVRGRVIGLTEMSWAAALLIGVPVLALVISMTSWRVAFAVTGVLNLVMLVVIRRSIPAEAPHAAHVLARSSRAVLQWRLVAPVVVGFALLMAASNFVIVVFGAWLEDAFGFGTARIGAVSFVLGAAELTASTSALRFTDRLGKRRAVLIGASLMVPAGLGLSLVGHEAVPGVALLVVLVLGFEYALVSSLPIVSELQPDARALSYGLALGAGTIGRGVAALVTTRLYTAHGMGASALGAAICASSAIVAFGAFVREPEPAR